MSSFSGEMGLRHKGKELREPDKDPTPWSALLGALFTVAIILVCEPFYPNARLLDFGLVLFIATVIVAYTYGTVAGLLSVALVCGYIAMSSQIPGSAFEYTPGNEARLVGTAIVCGLPAIWVGLVRAKIRRETRRAFVARQEAEQAFADLRESEEMRRLVVESSRDAIIAVDSEGKIILWNQNAEETFGWTANEIIGKPLQEIIPFEKAGDVAMARIETWGCTKQGVKIDVDFYLVPHSSSQGEVSIAFVRDISKRKATEAAIRDLNATLEQKVADRTAKLLAKNKELESFSYAISHDMRSPLRTIVANARIVLEEESGSVSESGRNHLERLVAGAMRMSLLVDNLLEHVRIGNLALHVEEVSLSQVAESAAAEVQKEYPAATFELESGLRTKGDPMLLSMLLTNLFDNACKYSRKGEVPKVRFGSRMVDGETIYFVEDNGIGIDMRYVHKLFRPFERLHNQEDFPGTGIGLANVRRTIERHGGRVWIEPGTDSGTVVLFTLGQRVAAEPVST
jgi:PAS domain S-box-containing protein